MTNERVLAPSRRLVLAAAAGLLLAVGAAAQCAPTFAPSYGIAAGPIVMSPIGGFQMTALCRWGDDLVVGGGMDAIGGVSALRVARWDGQQWNALPGVGTNGVNGRVNTLGVSPSGVLFIGGSFSMAGGQSSANMALYDGSNWGTGFTVNGDVRCHAFLPNGDLVIGGYFTGAGGVTANRVARFDGTNWSALGAGFDDVVVDLCVRQNGDLVAVGQFDMSGATATPRVARWDGAAWHALAASCNANLETVHERPDGSLVVGGSLLSIDGLTARSVARLDANGWTPLATQSNSIVRHLFELPDGTLCAAGNFGQINGVPATGLARWDGATWSSLGVTYTGGVLQDVAIYDGELVLVGAFQTVGGIASPYIARRVSTCPATATLLAPGCPGIDAEGGLAFAGGTWRSNVGGVAAPSIAVLVAGLGQTSLPLTSVFPTAAAGCTLHVTPDFLDFALVANGAHTWSWTLPSDPALAGATWSHQTLTVELPAGGGFGTVRASDAHELTVGVF